MLDEGAEYGAVEDVSLQQATGRAALHERGDQDMANLRVAFRLGCVRRLVAAQYAVNAGLECFFERCLEPLPAFSRERLSLAIRHLPPAARGVEGLKPDDLTRVRVEGEREERSALPGVRHIPFVAAA